MKIWRKRDNTALERELRAHIEDEAEERIGRGEDRERAVTEARRVFGSLAAAREQTREAWGWSGVERLSQDLRYGLRSLLRSPLYAVVAVATLALGIGANSAVFTLVRAVLLDPLPYPEPERLVTLLHGTGSEPVAPANFLDLQRESRSFREMGAARGWIATITGNGQPEEVWGLQLSAGVFPMLGVPPLAGRTPSVEEHEPGKERVLVLSYAFWQRRFQGDRGAVGQWLTVNGVPHQVIGIMPAGFQFAPFWLTAAEVWAPYVVRTESERRQAQYLRIFARLAPGVSIEQARAEVAGIWARLQQVHPEENAKLPLVLDTVTNKTVGNVRAALWILFSAVLFVLLIACTNLANLALARGVERQREFSIRAALGAGRGRLWRQLLTESLLLGAIGGVLGLLLAGGIIEWLQPSLPLPRAGRLRLDLWVVLYTGGLSFAAATVCGFLPAVQASRHNAGAALRQSGRGNTASTGTARWRSALIAGEVALSLVLLAGAGLLLRSFLALRGIEPGFDAKNLLTMTVSVAGQEGYVGERRLQFFREVAARVRALPGVRSTGLVNHLPVGGDAWGTVLHAEGQPLPKPGERTRATYRVALPGYFAAMGIRLIEGRDFTDADAAGAPGVILVNRRLAARFWPGESAIGKRVTQGDPRQPQWVTVVGVVADVKQDNWAAEPGLELYLPYIQEKAMMEDRASFRSYLTLVARTDVDPLSLGNAARDAVWSLNPEAPVSHVRSMEQVIAEATGRARFYALVLAVFAGFALLLAACGVYGVMAYSVNCRAPEIGIRMALGASRAAVVWTVMGQGVRLAGLGVAVGAIAAALATRGMGSMLYGVQPGDPRTIAAIAALLGVVAVVAAWLPARRAATMNPVAALRAQ